MGQGASQSIDLKLLEEYEVTPFFPSYPTVFPHPDLFMPHLTGSVRAFTMAANNRTTGFCTHTLILVQFVRESVLNLLTCVYGYAVELLACFN